MKYLANDWSSSVICYQTVLSTNVFKILFKSTKTVKNNWAYTIYRDEYFTIISGIDDMRKYWAP